MASSNRSLTLVACLFIIWVSLWCNDMSMGIVLAEQQSSLSCKSGFSEAFGHFCEANGSVNQCATFVLLYANSYYSSLSNFSFYLGLNPNAIGEASGLSKDVDVLKRDQPLLIPVDCQCDGSHYKARVTKSTAEGETFVDIAASLEGLTTCEAIERENPNLPAEHLGNKVQVKVPLICACSEGAEIMLSFHRLFYSSLFHRLICDTVSILASAFNISLDAIDYVNNKLGTPPSEPLSKNTTLLIPLPKKPNLELLKKTSMQVVDVSNNNTERVTCHNVGIYIGLSGVIIGVGVAMTVVVLVIKWRRKERDLCEEGDVELQHLTLRRPSKLIEEVEKLQDPANDENLPYIPYKLGLDTYSAEELRKATEDFNSSNFIEGTVFHGRLNGKTLAIKKTTIETISKIDYEVFQEPDHHSHILRLLGTCIGDGSESCLVFEYAKNGSLKDWLHGGLAMKSQFIASCYCFLSWNQRLRICLHVAMGLQYMHHIMNPCYIHRNIKSRNVLLDEEFNAKIANFGMSNCSADAAAEDSQLLPMSCSRGYLAPEYIEDWTLTTSTHIFAYGVVVLEVMSGQTPMARPNKHGEAVRLSEEIKLILDSEEDEQLRNFMDTALGEAYSFEAAMTLAKIAGACVEQDPSARPTAEELVQKLATLVKEMPEAEQTPVGECSSKYQVEVALISGQ